jgi:hypothetical protein
MRRTSYLLGLCALCLAVACSIPTKPSSDLDGGSDTLDLLGVDFAIAPGSIGASCVADTDCNSVASGVCWKKNILDDPGNLPTTNGYCTATCTSDADCGGTGTCQEVLAGASKYCLRSCITANTCRTGDGYACFIMTRTSGYCYPANRLSCNPTQLDPATGNGTCPGASPPSGCVRRTFEDLGECRPLCTGGPATCASAGGLAQHCVYLNATRTISGQPTRDAFKGLLCFPVYPDAKRPNDSCTYFDECTDGYQCNVVSGGDRKCHQLCTVGAQQSCGSPEICRDAFGAGTGNSGLCIQ